MFNRIAHRIAFSLQQNRIIESDDEEVYAYGIELFLMKAALYMIVLCLSFLTHSFIIGLAFVGTFETLRQFTGGFHCSTVSRCMIVSILMFIIMVIIYKINLRPIFEILFIVSVVAVIVIVLLSPIESVNNPLTEIEICRYRKTSILVSILLFLVSAVCFACHVTLVYYPISYALLADSILLIIAKGVNKNEEADS